ncbi:MAG: hypothetical protein AB1330_03510 [Bacillota bacterium]
MNKEVKVHTLPGWNEAVQTTRGELNPNLHRFGLQEVGEWLRRTGKEVVFSTAEKNFREVGLASRFFPYFLSCVLTHHQGAGNLHALPTDFGSLRCVETRVYPPPSMLVGKFYTHPAQGYFRIFYTPIPQEVAPGWETVGVPCDFEVWWPNFVVPRGLEIGPHKYPAIIGEEFVELQVVWCRFGVTGYFIEGETYILPLVYGPAVAGKTPREVFPEIPSTAAYFVGECCVPILSFPGLMGVVALDTAVGLSKWRVPRVNILSSASRMERKYCEVWAEFFKECALPLQLRPERGRPPTRVAAPGETFLEYLKGVYRDRLVKMGFTKPPHIRKEELLKVAKRSAKREARKKFPRDKRQKIPNGFWEEIEKEVFGEGER